MADVQQANASLDREPYTNVGVSGIMIMAENCLHRVVRNSSCLQHIIGGKVPMIEKEGNQAELSFPTKKNKTATSHAGRDGSENEPEEVNEQQTIQSEPIQQHQAKEPELVAKQKNQH